MALETIVNNQVSREAWQAFLTKNDFANPFQSPEGFDYLKTLNTMEVSIHAVQNTGDGEIRALVIVTLQQEPGIKKHFSSRGIIYGGPMLSDNESAKILLEHLKNYFKGKAIYLETRNFFNYSKYKGLFSTESWDYIPWLNFHLITDEEAAMRKRMSSSRLRQVKKGLKNGATWKEAKSLDEVKAFYNILKELYDEKIKKPLPKWDFFERFFYSKMGIYLMVEFEGKVIGGIMSPVLKDQAIYEWYIAGKDQEHRDQHPSVLATYAAMDYGVRNGLKYFDFMGAGPADEEYGVRDFKARFGGDQVEDGRFRLILKPILYKVGEAAIKIMSKVK